MRSYYRLMREDDLDEILSLDLRKADKEEAWASTGMSPAEALILSIKSAMLTWVVVHEDKIEAVFGLSYEGAPWFVATDKFKEFSYSFAKQAKEVVGLMLEICPKLANYVDSRHHESIKFLKWLGFDVDEEHPYYFADPSVPFYKFTKELIE